MNPSSAGTTASTRLETSELHIRDPFVVAGSEENTYAIFGSTGIGNGREAPGFYYHESKDLKTFSEPRPAFLAGPDLGWAHCFWAPEVFRFRDRWYMFASIGNDGTNTRRGVFSFIASSLIGPYALLSSSALTPEGDMCIDGTLFVDNNGDPWLVYCHEWWQITNGAILARRLSPDLSAGVGDAHHLFYAGDAPWTGNEPGSPARVTDGPFLHRTQDGALLMLWSSFDAHNSYCIAVASSTSGRISGPWDVSQTPLISENGGHAMLFNALDGTLMIAYHSQAQGWGNERAIFRQVDDSTSTLLLAPPPK